MDLVSVAQQMPNYVPGNYLVVTFAGRSHRVTRVEHVTPSAYHVRQFQGRGTAKAAWTQTTVVIRKDDRRLVGLLSPDLLRHFQVDECLVPLKAAVPEAAPAVRAAPVVAGTSPTRRQYGELDGAYDWFNRDLFQGQLPPCLVTLQRKAKTYGYFAPERFASKDMTDVTHEIAINPDHCRTRTAEDILSTLVHEMCHVQRHQAGKPPRNGYHDHQWADMMDAVGLTPVSDKGTRVGQKVSHTIVPGGPFADSVRRLLDQGWTLPYLQVWTEEGKKTSAKKKASKTKFECPCCGANAWGKPSLVIVCGPCKEVMVDENGGQPEADDQDEDLDQAA